MKVKVMSDCHLEFGPMEPGEGDVLVLAGDICTAEDIDINPAYMKFFHKCVKNYNKVYYVMGNHESYGCSIEETERILRNDLPNGITLLHNQSEYYEGTHFIGCTLWTDLNNHDSILMKRVERCMNDYAMIHDNSPTKSLERHKHSMEWLHQVLPTLRGDVFMITHHAPSFKSISSYYAHGIEGAYATNLEAFIQRYDSIKTWVHGHIHTSNDYYVGQCRVISNPRGYHPDALNPQFQLNKEISLNSS